MLGILIWLSLARKGRKAVSEIKNSYVAIVLAALVLTGCTMSLVASYDPNTVQQLEALEKRVDRFFLEASVIPEDQRQYVRFAKQYMDIEVDIRALVRTQKRRASNEETTKQAEILINLWNKDMQTHKAKDSLSNFMVKLRATQYERLFSAMLDGEVAKKLD